MIFSRKPHSVEAWEITHEGTFSTRAGMTDGHPGDMVIYDPEDVVYVIGENPRQNAHNWQLVTADHMASNYENTGAPDGQQLPPAYSDMGEPQFDKDGKFIGWLSHADIAKTAKTGKPKKETPAK